MFGLLTFHLSLPGCTSLKEKRGRLKPLIHRLQREFNVSVAEMDLQDKWREARVTCGMVGNERIHLEQSLQAVMRWVENNWPEGEVLDDSLEII
jgi:uncharacterized protein YlxP (DUF503 family)